MRQTACKTAKTVSHFDSLRVRRIRWQPRWLQSPPHIPAFPSSPLSCLCNELFVEMLCWTEVAARTKELQRNRGVNLQLNPTLRSSVNLFQTFNLAQVYLVRLWLGGCWRDTIVDDRLPCMGNGRSTCAPTKNPTAWQASNHSLILVPLSGTTSLPTALLGDVWSPDLNGAFWDWSTTLFLSCPPQQRTWRCWPSVLEKLPHISHLSLPIQWSVRSWKVTNSQPLNKKPNWQQRMQHLYSGGAAMVNGDSLVQLWCPGSAERWIQGTNRVSSAILANGSVVSAVAGTIWNSYDVEGQFSYVAAW